MTKTGTQNRPYVEGEVLMVRARLFGKDGKLFRTSTFNWNDRAAVRMFAGDSDKCIREGGRTELDTWHEPVVREHDYKSLAAHVAHYLTDPELSKLTELLDGDAGDDFLHHLNELNADRNPQDYNETKEKT